MLGIDQNLTQQEKRVLRRKASDENRAMKAQSAMIASSSSAVFEDSSDDSSDCDATVSTEPVAGPSTPKTPRLQLRGTK
jgi:hypothetical protein